MSARIPNRTIGGKSQEVSNLWLGSQMSLLNFRNWSLDFAILANGEFGAVRRSECFFRGVTSLIWRS